mmetsp:Transcript_12209/g.25796  ORF Transcript_12209/g.25796 Transcript_12209/m.25796 type:complete len:150 (+) Transcript_12209:1381-1830(+)
MVDKPVCEVLAAEVCVARRGLDLEDAVLDLQQGHIERAATHVIDENGLGSLLLGVKAIGKGRSGRLIDNAEHIEAADDSCILSGLPLRVVEVCGHSDDGIGHRHAQVRLSCFLHLLQHHGRDLLRVETLGVALELDLDHRLFPPASGDL